MKRYYYSDTIQNFLSTNDAEIIGVIASNNEFSLELTQRESWKTQIILLREILKNYNGSIFFEYSIPRMGRRIDVVLIIKNTIFILEFKVGEKEFLSSSLDQVWDYALDLKNFHETSHQNLIAPILIATHAKQAFSIIELTPQKDNLLFPIKSNAQELELVIKNVLDFADGDYIDETK